LTRLSKKADQTSSRAPSKTCIPYYLPSTSRKGEVDGKLIGDILMGGSEGVVRGLSQAEDDHVN